jgi:hypothetical protein
MEDIENDELHTSSDGQRRSLLLKALNLPLVAATAAIGPAPGIASDAVSMLVPTPPSTKDVSWPLGKVAFSLLPLAGTSTRRATVEEEVVKDTIFTYDQIQGVVNVNVPVRQTVVRLKEGGIFVHNPVA